MGTPAHLDQNTILSIASGESPAFGVIEHLQACEECREELEEIRSFLAAIGEELMADRPGCPSPEELAEIPAGGQSDHPHVKLCPLCRAELEMLADLEARDSLGFELEHGAPIRGGVLRQDVQVGFAAGGSTNEVELVAGKSLELEVAGIRVEIEVSGEEILVRLHHEPDEPLDLVMFNESFESRMALSVGENRQPIGSWERARVEVRGDQ